MLGRVREDVIPQVADLGLQAEGAEWAVAAGIVGSDLVFSVRNVGYVRAAGDVVRAVVEGLGVGGGHRSMAKGIVPLKAFRKVHGARRPGDDPPRASRGVPQGDAGLAGATLPECPAR